MALWQWHWQIAFLVNTNTNQFNRRVVFCMWHKTHAACVLAPNNIFDRTLNKLHINCTIAFGGSSLSLSPSLRFELCRSVLFCSHQADPPVCKSAREQAHTYKLRYGAIYLFTFFSVRECANCMACHRHKVNQ